MRVAPAQLPSYGMILRALRAQSSAGKSWKMQGDRAFFYSQARWAIQAAVISLAGGMPSEVWAPAYICTEAVDALRGLATKFRFYEVTEDLGIDWATIRPESGSNVLSILIIVHYFGFPNDIHAAKEFCTNAGMALLEDAAHVLSPQVGQIGSLGDMVVYSPRKLLPVPDGGILVQRNSGVPLTPVEELPSEGGWHAAWILQKLAQTTFRSAGLPYIARSTTESGNHAAPHQMAGNIRTRQMLSVLEPRIEEIRETRRRNYVALLQQTMHSEIEPIFPTLDDEVCPYLFPVRIRRGSAGIRRVLRSQGIPAGSWPDLPDEVKQDQRHVRARAIRDSILTLPVHQDVTEADLSVMAASLRCAADSAPK